jgi:hypothetical protein
MAIQKMALMLFPPDFNGIITFVTSVKHSLKSNSIITTDGTIVLSNVISLKKGKKIKRKKKP